MDNLTSKNDVCTRQTERMDDVPDVVVSSAEYGHSLAYVLVVDCGHSLAYRGFPTRMVYLKHGIMCLWLTVATA